MDGLFENSNDRLASSGKKDQFIKENPTKSNSIEIPSIKLPKGGGALKGIDEKFQVNPSNGTAGLNIPLPASPGRNGFGPALALSYNSGSGNSAFGLGWEIGLPAIQRRTAKKLPVYRDFPDEDIFMFTGVEDLVPMLIKSVAGDWINAEAVHGDYTVKRYRPRMEGNFAKIERIIHPAHGMYWKVTTNENIATIFGRKKENRISDPQDDSRIFQWLPEFTYDDKGNWMSYGYKEDSNLSAADRLLLPDEIHEQNRKNGNALFLNRYLKKIFYGNHVAYYADATLPFDAPIPADAEHFFEMVLDYGEHDPDIPLPTETTGLLWPYRPDAFSNYHAGFEIRTARLCQRILMFHHFRDEENFGVNYLVRSLDLEYIPSSINNSGNYEVTYLSGLTQHGYIRLPDGSYSKKSLPKLEFEYQQLIWNKEIQNVSEESLVNAPAGLTGSYQWTDFYGEGVPGIFSEQANAWFYKNNLGTDSSGELILSAAELIAPKPSYFGTNSGALQFQDLEGNGERQLVVENSGFFELTDDNEWEPFRSFLKTDNLSRQNSYVRMVDLNGDGRPDLLMTEENVLIWYPSEGKQGRSGPAFAEKAFDEERSPAIVFSDPLETIFLADMSGDGMTDIVRIRNGEICYWPNKGYGKFGAKINMGNAPRFDLPDLFNPVQIHLADISGTGATDILYTGKNSCRAYINLSGNTWNSGEEIETFPRIQHTNQLAVIDLLSTGTACLVWSSDLPRDAAMPMKYIDLLSSRKPHVMIKQVNNMGKEVSLEYKSSSFFFLQDKKAGHPWITKLPFPVQVVASMTMEEKISRVKFTTAYSYHHGYYDHAEKEFRGFGRVEQLDSEAYENWKLNAAGTVLDDSEPLYQQPVLTKTWFHTGAYLRNNKILSLFETEYWYNEMQRQGFAVTVNEPKLPDVLVEASVAISDKNILNELNAFEWREISRGCKGMMLRQEVFALDAPASGATPAEIQLQLTPYSLATHNCRIVLAQPRGKNPYAVLMAGESESFTISYERNTADPRISHSLNIRVNEYNQVLESAAVVYPRMVTDVTLPAETQAAQNKMIISYASNIFTNDILSDPAYRLRLPAEIKTYELKGVLKTGTFFSPENFSTILTDAAEVPYADISSEPPAGSSQKRLIENIRTNYLKNDLSGALPLNLLESLALSFQNFQLAYTPDLLNDIYSAKADAPTLAALMTEGKFDHSIDGSGNPDANWWIRSGTVQLLSGTESINDAQARFYLPISYMDPFGSITTVDYYKDYFLFVQHITDALSNTSGVDLFNFRTMSAQRTRDINNNLSETISDELGLVKAMALFGKGSEADDLTGLSEVTTAAETTAVSVFFSETNSVMLVTEAKNLLQHATARFLYDFDMYRISAKPAVVASVMREEHYQINKNSSIQIGFVYTSGLGQTLMKKAQAEPGPAKKITVNPDNSFSVTDVDTSASGPPALRWIGNGRTILNNKGNPVKQYEPYFSVSQAYEDEEELVETGVTPILFYDALGRTMRTELPDGTFTRIEFDSWKQIMFDAGDTVLDSSWYTNRVGRLIDAELFAEGKDPVKEKEAADQSAAYANTPGIFHFDTLGRPVLSVDIYQTKVDIDSEGNPRSITDARENVVVSYKFDMLGHRVYQNSMDAGQRWLLINALGSPLRTWDERNQKFQFSYDVLHRPLYKIVTGGDGSAPLNNIFEKVIYGETGLFADKSNLTTLQADNVLGKPVQAYDTGGVILSPQFDFKGQPLFTSRRLFKNYRAVANWTDPNMATDLEADVFTYTTQTDALGRITSQTAPDGSVTVPSYNRTGLLNAESSTVSGTTTIYIKDIDYNEKGQRNKIIYGNDVTTTFNYDRLTFRLQRLTSIRKNNDPLQDWYYTFDSVGNITHIEDKDITVNFFDNSKTDGVSNYIYDALYRLTQASGRENNAALVFDATDNWNDGAYINSLNPGDPMAVRSYTQDYQYDSVGNILQMKHASVGNNWTRSYNYGATSNRLLSTQVGALSYPYDYHPKHGFMTAMPHLPSIQWTFKEELASTSTQKVNPENGTAETTYYQYDGRGQRIRKITENAASAGASATIKEERIYISGYETYRTYAGAAVNFERQTLSLIDQGNRFVMIETVVRNNNSSITDAPGSRLVRYQMHNHIGSTSLELDATALVISYEEYHPFGSTAFQANNNSLKASAKRYRYTGMERDDETGLQYNSARYYINWLGRWLSTDPKEITEGSNLYQYSRNNPIVRRDVAGTQSKSITVDSKVQVVNKRTKKLETVSESHVTILPEVVVEGKPDSTSNDLDSSNIIAIGSLSNQMGSQIDFMRNAYNTGAKKILEKAHELIKSGKSEADAARWLVAERNKLKELIRNEGPELYKLSVERRNLGKYGDKVGPEYEALRSAKIDKINASQTLSETEKVAEIAKVDDKIIEGVTKTSSFYNKIGPGLKLVGQGAQVMGFALTAMTDSPDSLSPLPVSSEKEVAIEKTRLHYDIPANVNIDEHGHVHKNSYNQVEMSDVGHLGDESDQETNELLYHLGVSITYHAYIPGGQGAMKTWTVPGK